MRKKAIFLPAPTLGASRRALSQARPQRVKQAEVKVELRRLLPFQPRPEPQPFRKPADFFRIRRDLVGLRKDGTEFPLTIHLTPLTTAGGVYVMAFTCDTHNSA